MISDSFLHSVTKPARYTGGEWNSIIKEWEKTPVKIAISYPDTYEIGMSNIAVPILYELLNCHPDVLAERVYAPWTDMEEVMRKQGIPLYSLESKKPLKDFDVIGFSLGYELTFTNVLNMLDLAQIPLRASERNDSHPLVIAGGSCCLNPEPMSDFIDVFFIGDGEDSILEFIDVFRKWKAQGNAGKAALLRQAAGITGVYVPSLYEVEYHGDGTLKSIAPKEPETKVAVRRSMIDKLPPPVIHPVVPYIETIHDRGAIEIQRGCSCGCRFCQAGIIYRPVRERPHEEVLAAAGEIIRNCGYDELSLVSLNTTDYKGIDKLVASLADRYPDLKISLPSLRIDSFSLGLLESLPKHNKTGLTFAPEAGSSRLRGAINKNIDEEKILQTVAAAFSRGWTGLKLYFMVGLPTETVEDVNEIVTLVEKIRLAGRAGARAPQLRVSVSTFVPKPHTPFQWVGQITESDLNAKQAILKAGLNRKGLKFSWQDPKISLLEATLSRGDRRLGNVIHSAWKQGAKFDAWTEHFSFDRWLNAFKENGLDPAFYAHRPRALDEVLPWSHIDAGVSVDFLKREYERASAAEVTPDCRFGVCSACGLQDTQVCAAKKA